MATRAPADLIVVGGGVIGLAIAWEASRAGLQATVVDPLPGHGASWAAAGMLGPVGEAHFGEEALIALNLVAAKAWPGFAATLEEATGHNVGYLTTGTLMVAVDASDRLATDDALAFQLGLGLPARRLSARQARELEPLLAPGIRGGTYLPSDHQVDNRLVVSALLVAAERQGVTFVEDEVAAVNTDGARATGVTLRSGQRLPGGAVVLAAGCRSGQVDGVPEASRPPVRPVKGLTLRLRRPTSSPALRRTVRGLVRGRTCYLVPRQDGTVVVGATVEEKGFDLTVHAGSVGDLLDDARLLVPTLEEYELGDTTTGLRPGSPDNCPIVGPSDLPGLFVATGHYRNGILLAPITAATVVSMLLVDHAATVAPTTRPVGDPPSEPDPFGPFGPGRFARRDGRGRPVTVAR
jgi:glycine oxidase